LQLEHRNQCDATIIVPVNFGVMENFIQTIFSDGVSILPEKLLSLTNDSFRALTDQMPQMLWSTLPDGYHDYYNRRWYEFTGVPVGSTNGEAWNGMFHPDDQAKAWSIWQNALKTGEPYEVEYRLRHYSGEYRWTIGRALPIRDDGGQIIRWIGTCTDIHQQKLLLERNEILSQELSHRIKNIFSVINALIGLSAHDYPESKEYAQTLRERITALGSAHEFVRPHSERSRPQSIFPTLQGMMGQIFAAYPAYAQGRLTISGDDLPIDDQAATPMALVFHELATNAVKYGALSNGTGTVAIDIDANDKGITITWSETGGKPVTGEPVSTGFGTRLIAMSIERQMGGGLKREWTSAGLKMEISLPLERLHR
jgi:PAS domain S-box-containing protein